MCIDFILSLHVNHLGTALLALLLLPYMASSPDSPRITIVSSEVHYWAKFPEAKATHILNKLNDEKTARMGDQYEVSKRKWSPFLSARPRSLCDRPPLAAHPTPRPSLTAPLASWPTPTSLLMNARLPLAGRHIPKWCRLAAFRQDGHPLSSCRRCVDALGNC